MKVTFLFFVAVFLGLSPILALGQGIVFEQGSWIDAVKKAKKQKKLLFLHFDKPGCGGCDDVASAAFNSPYIREKFAANFISYRVDGSAGTGKELADRLEVTCLPSSVYLDLDENLLARYCGSTSLDRTYLDKAEEALAKHREQPMKALTDAYAKGDRSSALMRQYIKRRREMDLSTNDLLTEYVQTLPADSLQSGTLLRFLFEQGPVVGSKADSVLRRNPVRTDSIYRAVGWNKAVELNNLITNNSLQKAIKDKDRKLASRTASFRMRTYTNNFKAGYAANQLVMMRYFKGVNDTTQFLNYASTYYDTHFMVVKVDSIQNMDMLDNQRRMKGIMPPSSAQKKLPGGGISVIVNPNTQRYVSALNQAAWDFYEMTRNPTYLKKALEWSKRTLEFREDPSSMDTYAHILYRLGRKEEAIEWQEKAVKRESEFNMPLSTSMQKSLRKMKDGTL